MGLLSKLFNREIPDLPVQDNTFHLVVEDTFAVTTSGITVVGRVDSGEIHLGDTVYINGTISTTVEKIELKGTIANKALAGEWCALSLKDVSTRDVKKGDYISK